MAAGSYIDEAAESSSLYPTVQEKLLLNVQENPIESTRSFKTKLATVVAALTLSVMNLQSGSRQTGAADFDSNQPN